MNKIAIGNHLTSYLLALCVLLVVVVALESRNLAVPRDEPATGTPPPAETVSQNTFTMPPVTAFNGITERPLFTQGREPPPKPEVAAAPVNLQPLRLKLEGVAITPEASIAMLRDLASNEILRLGKGMNYKGWELTAVSATGVTFRLGEQDQEINLYVEEQAARTR